MLSRPPDGPPSKVGVKVCDGAFQNLYLGERVMSTVRSRSAIALTTAALLLGAVPASADLVFNSAISIQAQGFGNAPRLLTIQSPGSTSTESGAIGISAGNLVGLTPGISDALVHSGNGVTNAGGNTVSPLSDNQKFGIPTLSSLGWTSGASVALLFNATEPGGGTASTSPM
jgi:hypothetical protein